MAKLRDTRLRLECRAQNVAAQAGVRGGGGGGGGGKRAPPEESKWGGSAGPGAPGGCVRGHYGGGLPRQEPRLKSSFPQGEWRRGHRHGIPHRGRGGEVRAGS